MPREEVPYPCDCGDCSTSQKLKTINGIEPNSGGNISILGDEGVTVKTDKDNHIVTFGIDTSTIDNVRHADSADTAQTAGIADKATTADSATKATYDANGKTIMNTDGTQNVTGAKTFVGDQVFTGAINASNTANVLKAANHNSILTSNDVLTAKDINEANGTGNNLLHRSGNETKVGSLGVAGDLELSHVDNSNSQIYMRNSSFNRTVKPSAEKILGNIIFGNYAASSFVTLYAVQKTDGSVSVILATQTNKGNWRTAELLKTEWEE